MDGAIDLFKSGYLEFAFRGNYIGVNPDDSSDTCDLHSGYIENKHTSYPTFHYYLFDIITIV